MNSVMDKTRLAENDLGINRTEKTKKIITINYKKKQKRQQNYKRKSNMK